MGLGYVEVLLDVEEAFGISIPDEIATSLLTVQDMIDYVASQVATIPQEKCETQRIYCRLRHGFRDQIPALINDFDLQMKLKDVLCKDQWERVWAAVREQVGEAYWPQEIPWSRVLASGPVTVRDLAYYIAFALPKPNAERNEPWTRERIALHVREILRDQTTGDVSFKRTARFVKDLHID